MWINCLVSCCTGSTAFPYNPLTIRMMNVAPTSIACAPPTMGQASSHPPPRTWEREPAPLLSSQYETLSDSDDWTQGSGWACRQRVFQDCPPQTRDSPQEPKSLTKEVKAFVHRQMQSSIQFFWADVGWKVWSEALCRVHSERLYLLSICLFKKNSWNHSSVL